LAFILCLIIFGDVSPGKHRYSIYSPQAENENPERTFEFSKIKGCVRFDSVCYHYEDGKNVLSEISFDIREGEKVAIVGKSGAGKSTLVQLILGLYEPIEGRIEVDSVDIRTVRLDSLRNRIGIVSQNIFLFNDTILNNIKYSRAEASIDEVLTAAKASGCHDFISQFPHGYDTNAGEVGKRLSGGERQRISIARCLLKKPDLIIFDEPTTHLDSVSGNNIISTIKSVFKNNTCIIISHHINNIQWVDKILVLKYGRLVQEGTHQELAVKEGEYQNLFLEK
jgi:ABC-type multidrug transport system fused ATPase/permease subunit